ncbi:CPBP family intramembrane metalloprotease [Pleurocapsales cyanobacterium LEGE 10410]|nr:CPBP family intramembrane metalloprotease [Pleurocapsales cyanobacterium LEGE 10410]
MTLKRAILALLTIFAIARIGFSLNNSLSQPQIQSRLELYQTNLVLHIAEFKSSPADDFELNTAVNSLVGEDPYSAASKKYQQVRQETATSRDKFKSQLQQLDSLPTNLSDGDRSEVNLAQKKQLETQITELGQFINELDLKRGILAAVQEQPQEAIAIWNSAIARINNPENSYAQTAKILKELWQEQPQEIALSRSMIESNLDSWFRYQALAKLYRVNNLDEELAALTEQELQIATKSVFKLALISGIPFFGGISGVIILIILIVQRFTKPEKSIVATNSNTTWETPWNWEITWQVLIVGFFFIGQFVLPLLLAIFNVNPVNSSLRIKALYVLVTYILMAIGGISVLYFSIKSFFPLPKDWFKFKFNSNWFWWGFGGYLVAIPLVLIVSLINQQIWQGQGGSNPLLFLALQAQDKVALLVFFSTASIAAPIFEEIMFRGFLLPSLTRYVSVTGAIVISGLIFAIAHLSLSEVLPLATLGIVLGVVYTRSRSLLAPMLLHCLWNSGTLVSLFVLGSGV